MDWKLVLRLGMVEVWRTSSKYLVCIHYEGYYKFFDRAKTAIDFAHSLVNIK